MKMIKKIIHHKKIYHAEDNFKEPVGHIYLVENVGGHFYEIEYEIDEKYRGKGLMTYQLFQYIQDLKKNDLPKKTIIALVDNNNFASKKVLEKNGFQPFVNFKKNIDTYLYLLN